MMSETGLPLTETGPPPAGTCRLAPVWVTWISQCSGAISGSFRRTVTSPAEPILFTPWFSSTCECSPLGNTSFMSALLRIRGQALPGAATAAVYPWADTTVTGRSEEHTSELQSRENLVCRLLLEKKNLK